MKNSIFTLILAGCAALSAQGSGQGTAGIKQLGISRAGDRLTVEMSLDASTLSLKGNREILYTPMLVNGSDTLRMAPFTIAGRNRYYRHLRNDAGNAPALYRSGEKGAVVDYRQYVDWHPWMETASLDVEVSESGCCGEPVSRKDVPVAGLDFVPKVFAPDFAFVSPVAEAVKLRKISARAYIDFPVNKTGIYPSYRRNPSELAKIRATIDSVRNDSNLTITEIHIKGFASPEGSYANNTRLAKGRTATLAEYVRGLYHFGRNVITTSYEPEDWKGLYEYVASEAGKRALSNPEGVLGVITDPAYDRDEDRRDAALRREFPADYAFLLKEVYPGLRHSDYDVNFSVRSFTDPAEIIETMHKAPQNLSLQELYTVARTQEPGSDLFNEAFEIAVRMYPDDEVANLNAGFNAMQRGDLKGAARYLKKAGDSPEAQYARAVLTAKEGDKEEAVRMLSRISTLPQAAEALRQLENCLRSSGRTWTQLTDKI